MYVSDQRGDVLCCVGTGTLNPSLVWIHVRSRDFVPFDFRSCATSHE